VTEIGAGTLVLVIGVLAAPLAMGALVAGLDFTTLSVSFTFEVWAAATIATAAALGRSLRTGGRPASWLGAAIGFVGYGFVVFPVLWLIAYVVAGGESLGW
jgi:hypothetical protein